MFLGTNKLISITHPGVNSPVRKIPPGGCRPVAPDSTSSYRRASLQPIGPSLKVEVVLDRVRVYRQAYAYERQEHENHQAKISLMPALTYPRSQGKDSLDNAWRRRRGFWFLLYCRCAGGDDFSTAAKGLRRGRSLCQAAADRYSWTAHHR